MFVNAKTGRDKPCSYIIKNIVSFDQAQVNSNVPQREAAAARAHDRLEHVSELVRVRGLVKHFPVEGSHDVVRAGDRVTCEVLEAETLGLVGASGGGKSTVGRSLPLL